MKGDGYGLFLRAMGCYKDVFFCSTDTGSPCLVSRMDHRDNPCKQRIKDSICIKVCGLMWDTREMARLLILQGFWSGYDTPNQRTQAGYYTPAELRENSKQRR